MTTPARSVKNAATWSAATPVRLLTTLQSANQCLGIHREFTQDEKWYCPPCQKERKLREKAALEGWSPQKLADSLNLIKQQRETFALPKREYEDPVPVLRQITDFNSSTSEEDEDNGEEGTITRIGTQFQVVVPEFGRISMRHNEYA